MNGLTVFNHNNKMVIDSREVAEMVGKRHDHLLRDIKNYSDILSTSPDLGALNFFIEFNYKDSKGELRPCYLLTKKGCDMVANKMTGEKGILFTAAYVSRFEEMEEQLKNKFQIPKTMSEALRLAADQQEIIEYQNKQLEEQKPKVLFADSVETSKTSILIGELAKIIKQNGVNVGRDRLFQWMRENGYLEKRGENKNLPTQRYMEMKLFEIKKTTINNPDGSSRQSRTTKITGKGQIYFMNIFLKHKELLQ
ncbi:MAG: phage regulatory protein/antirepressor Ant [Anaerovoracaceae bacterium]